MMQLSLLSTFDALAPLPVMHPTAAELQAQMDADEAAEAARYCPPITPAELPHETYDAPPARKARKPRRAPQNVADSTPF